MDWFVYDIGLRYERVRKALSHLGDLHRFMEFFGMVAKLESCSVYEDTIYQAELCTSGRDSL